MKLLFLSTYKPTVQGDYLEISLLYGLRKILGENCVDYPRKDIMYHDFSKISKETLHGRGFTLLSKPLEDVLYDRNNIKLKDFDTILLGSGHIYGAQVS